MTNVKKSYFINFLIFNVDMLCNMFRLVADFTIALLVGIFSQTACDERPLPQRAYLPPLRPLLKNII